MKPQRSVDELRRENAIADVELEVALELGVENGRRVRAIMFDAHDHVGGDGASGRRRARFHSGLSLTVGGGVFVVLA